MCFSVCRDVVDETLYPSTFDPQKLMDIMEYLDVDMAEALAGKLVGQRPNTYTFTKSVAEALVGTMGKGILEHGCGVCTMWLTMRTPLCVRAAPGKGLPIAVIRPSIVGSAWREPFPGWVDNFNGPAGLALAAGTGILRVLPGIPATAADIIPVDTCVGVCVCVCVIV